jgi:hypothetical protein
MAEFPGAVKKKLSTYAPNTEEINSQKKPTWTDDTGNILVAA